VMPPRVCDARGYSSSPQPMRDRRFRRLLYLVRGSERHNQPMKQTIAFGARSLSARRYTAVDRAGQQSRA
jgi:hypothetical protein